MVIWLGTVVVFNAFLFVLDLHKHLQIQHETMWGTQQTIEAHIVPMIIPAIKLFSPNGSVQTSATRYDAFINTTFSHLGLAQRQIKSERKPMTSSL